jgi:hypothetical protein
VWSTGEHFVSCAHVRQRQGGADLWNDGAILEQPRNRAEPRGRTSASKNAARISERAGTKSLETTVMSMPPGFRT